MKSVKPIVLLSFLFFASIIADDLSDPISTNNNEISDYEDSDDFDYDYNDDDDEDIIYTGMISAKPAPTPPPVKGNTSPSLIKTPVAPPTTPPPCKKWRCSMNGYIPKWKPDVSVACRDNYSKMGIMTKAVCQDQFCEKVCEKF